MMSLFFNGSQYRGGKSHVLSCTIINERNIIATHTQESLKKTIYGAQSIDISFDHISTDQLDDFS